MSLAPNDVAVLAMLDSDGPMSLPAIIDALKEVNKHNNGFDAKQIACGRIERLVDDQCISIDGNGLAMITEIGKASVRLGKIVIRP